MPFELREVEDLAETLGSDAIAHKELKRRGIPVWDGLYNHGAFVAFDHEPRRTNIASKNKAYWTMAETDGLGSIKAILDKLDLDIALHQYHRTNWITARNSVGKRTQLKVYVTQKYLNRNERAAFTLSGFLKPSAPDYFMCVCFQGSRAWVVSKKRLKGLHSKVFDKHGEFIVQSIKKGPKDAIETTYSIPLHYRKRFTPGAGDKDGHIHITFDSNDDFRLLMAKQIGL